MNDSSTHVLLIEDNPGDADLVRLRLVEANADLKVRSTNRLAAGLAAIDQQPPSVVLLDLNLPDSHGADTFRQVLEHAPGVAVVVLSGQDDEELAAKAVHQGVQDYLIKGSFTSKQLARAMRYAVERQALITSLDMSRKQQLQFKDEFLSHVSHELRTPLTSIHQFVTILLDGLAGPMLQDQREHLQTILKSANQLRAMIGDLLEATRAESGKLRIEVRCISVGDVLEQAVSMLRATAAEKHIAIHWTADARMPFLTADPERVLQILINLLDNSLKFTSEDGSITVKAGLLNTDPEFAYISVIDNGRGISPEGRPLVFERLYQDPNAVHESRRGLGLGLCIVQELVRLHGGKIWLESKLGEGSVFTFTLPVFSLPKLLAPTITEGDKLRAALSLVGVALTPYSRHQVDAWREMRDLCKNILQACIWPVKDVVLPPLSNVGSDLDATENFFAVVSTDLVGARIVQKRISTQLEKCPQLRANSEFSVVITAIPIPVPQPSETLGDQVQGVADIVTALIVDALKRGPSPTKNGSETVHKQLIAPGREFNGKTENLNS